MWELKKYKYFFLVVASHLALLYTLFYGNTAQIISMLSLHILNIWIAGTVTYHRLLSHRSWNAPKWFEVFGTILGIFSFTGSSITRVIFHRQHHLYPDSEKDPHSPWINTLWQQYFPMLYYNGKINLKLGRDIYRDPFHKFIHEKYLLIIGITFLVVGLLAGFDWAIATVLAPGCLSWFTIFLGNTLCHLGKDSQDRSRDDLLIVLLGFGEGWHGYHHRNPNDPQFSKGKFDPGWFIIKLLEKQT